MGWDGDEYQKQFDALADEGVDVHGEVEFLMRFAPTSVLDAGCGTGRVARELARRGVAVVGVDADASMVATARRLSPELDWRVDDLCAFDLGHTFALVVMAGNVPLFTPAGTQRALVGGCARHLDARRHPHRGVLARSGLRHDAVRRGLRVGGSRARRAVVDVVGRAVRQVATTRSRSTRGALNRVDADRRAPPRHHPRHAERLDLLAFLAVGDAATPPRRAPRASRRTSSLPTSRAAAEAAAIAPGRSDCQSWKFTASAQRPATAAIFGPLAATMIGGTGSGTTMPS